MCSGIIARGCCANTYRNLKLQPHHRAVLQPGILPKVLGKSGSAARCPAHTGCDGAARAGMSDWQESLFALDVGTRCWLGCVRREAERGPASPRPYQSSASAFPKGKDPHEAACAQKQACLLTAAKGPTTIVPASLKFNSSRNPFCAVLRMLCGKGQKCSFAADTL